MTVGFRRRGDLGLRQAGSDRLLPLLAAAMVFLASLAGAARVAADGLAARWADAAAGVLVQVPDPLASGVQALPAGVVPASPGRGDAVAALLPAGTTRLSAEAVRTLLRPWLGAGFDPAGQGIALPAVFLPRGDLQPGTQALLERAAPGTLVSRGELWQARLAALAASLRRGAGLALASVAVVAAGVVVLATRAGLAASGEAIGIVHGLGATDGMIAARLSARTAALVFAGAVAGAAAGLPVLLGLARITAAFVQGAQVAPAGPAGLASALPAPLWLLLAGLPPAAACLGWATAQATLRGWLARMP